MPTSPRWKVYTASGEYIAACKHAQDAARLVARYGDDARIRFLHGRAVWIEGREAAAAAESYRRAAAIMQWRVLEHAHG